MQWQKIKFLLFWFVVTASTAGAQTSRQLHDSIALRIQHHYNSRQPNRIYQLSGTEFQKKMTETQFAQGMGKFYAKSGHWQTLTYQSADETGLNYSAQFENTLQTFSIKLGADGRVTRLNFAAVPVVIAAKTHEVASNNPLKDSTDLLVERLIRPYIQKGNTSGLALAILHKGLVRTYSYGSTSKETNQLPDPAKTVFEIGSVTKTFTSLLLADEVIAGRMKLDDPVNKYLPDSVPKLNYQGVAITLKHLANHTSGLPRLPTNIFNGRVDPRDPYQHYLVDSLYSFLVHYPLTAKPGTKFSYSNFGAGLLGAILERHTGKRFEDLVVDRICRPLGMRHTSVSLDQTARQHFAQGYNESGQTTAPWELASLQGSGAIRSTLNDMILYAQAQIGEAKPLGNAIQLSHQPTFISAKQSMALGWRVENEKNSYLYHAGGTGGFRSFISIDQRRKLGVVILSNAAEEVAPIGKTLISTFMNL